MNLDGFFIAKLKSLQEGFSSADLASLFSEFDQELVCPNAQNFLETFEYNLHNTYIACLGNSDNARPNYVWLNIRKNFTEVISFTSSVHQLVGNPRKWYVRTKVSTFANFQSKWADYKLATDLASMYTTSNFDYAFIVPNSYKPE